MAVDFARLMSIFQEAVEKHSPEAWDGFVRAAAEGDTELYTQVRQLLDAHVRGGSLLDRPAVEVNATIERPVAEKIGTQIGPYKLLQEIGEGGMGMVYMAEQSHPVKRRVALKIIKPGMDSRQVIARFEAERQALSMMDHPHIAKVLDAGTTDSGRPYFVMELVKGTPITQYCDQCHLSLRQRLELFVPVCQAIQHAHHKGIIHRDVKPSNILVAEYDGHPVPKVIDFGVAKALHQTLTDKTLFTGYGQVVGTLEYMSPEQASVNQLDVDTRSDIYSLGVLLYELLTGTTPFDRQRLRSAAWEEMLRIIREEEPPRPSIKLSTIDTLPSVAANRRMEPAKLTGLVRGELDWIALKALEKDRNRRYEAAAALAADIQHYLNDEPVQACPPSRTYRLRKFARRNKVAFATTGLVALALVVGTGVATWQAVRAVRAERAAMAAAELEATHRKTAEAAAVAERQAKESEAKQRRRAETSEQEATESEQKATEEAAVATAINEFLRKDLLGLADARAQLAAGIKPDPDIKLATLLDRALSKVDERFADQPRVRAEVQQTLAATLLRIGCSADAARLYEQVLQYHEQTLGARHPDTLVSMNNLALAYNTQARYAEAESLFVQALEGLRSVHSPEHPDTLCTMHNLALVYDKQGRYTDAESLLTQTIEARRRVLGPEDPATLLSQSNLVLLYEDQRKFDAAEQLGTQVLEIRRRVLGAEHPDTLRSIDLLSMAYLAQGKFAEAEPLATEVLEVNRRVQGPEHPDTLTAMNNLASVYRYQKKLAEAESLFVKVLELARRIRGADHPETVTSMNNLAAVYIAQSKYAEVEPLLTELLAIQRRTLPADHPDVADTQFALGMSLARIERYAEAEPLLAECVAIRDKKLPNEWPRFAARSWLAKCLVVQQKFPEAESLLTQNYETLSALPPESRSRFGNYLTDALKRLVQLYEGWGKPEEAQKWQALLDQAGSESPKPVEQGAEKKTSTESAGR
jgi:eukaryotic-like serine/threonine-protein kinase